METEFANGLQIRPITAADDAQMSALVQANLKAGYSRYGVF